MPEDVAVALIRALMDNLSGRQLRDDWSSFAMVLVLDEGDLSGTSGYAYSPGGEISAMSARPSSVRGAVLDYLRDHLGSEEKLPVKMLVQFDRTSGRYSVTFEDKDKSRWRVTPANYREVREDLRPAFDA